MIKEDYVSFETARLLKEKGFNEYVMRWYIIEDNGVIAEVSGHSYSLSKNSSFKNGEIGEPTLQMAMKWLREEHNLFIQVIIVPHTTITMEQKYYLFLIHKNRRRLYLDDTLEFTTYEEACEVAIKYCLENLIQPKQ